MNMFKDPDGVALEILSHVYNQYPNDTNCNRIARCVRAAFFWYHPTMLVTHWDGYFNLLAEAGFLTWVEANAWEDLHRRDARKFSWTGKKLEHPAIPGYFYNETDWDKRQELDDRMHAFEAATLEHAYRLKYPTITDEEIWSMQEHNLKNRKYAPLHKRQAAKDAERKEKKKREKVKA